MGSQHINDVHNNYYYGVEACCVYVRRSVHGEMLGGLTNAFLQ